MRVAIIDYGSGNLRSATKAFERAAREAGIEAEINLTDKAEIVAAADRIVLPGVGAYADCRRGLDAVPGMRLRETAFRDPNSYFHRYASISEEEAAAIAEDLWANINLKNLRQNILPTRPRADLILRKGKDHLIEQVALRKL